MALGHYIGSHMTSLYQIRFINWIKISHQSTIWISIFLRSSPTRQDGMQETPFRGHLQVGVVLCQNLRSIYYRPAAEHLIWYIFRLAGSASDPKPEVNGGSALDTGCGAFSLFLVCVAVHQLLSPWQQQTRVLYLVRLRCVLIVPLAVLTPFHLLCDNSDVGLVGSSY